MVQAAPVLGIDVPVSEEDPYDDRWLDETVAFQDMIRETGRVVWLNRVGCYAVGRHADVVAVLRNWQDYGSSHGVGLSNFATGKTWRQKSLLLEADPPHHDAPHRVLADLLGPRTQGGLRDELRRDADRLVDQLLARGPRFDAFTDLAMAYPLEAFPNAVGITRQDRYRLMEFSDFLFNAFGPRNDLVREGGVRAKENSEWVDRHCNRDALAPGGLGEMIWRAADRGDITYDQAPQVVRSLFAAGVNTTVHALGSLLYALSTHPEQWALVRGNEVLRRRALDEAIRWASPIQTFYRTTMSPLTLGGVGLAKHEKIMLLMGSANRDPRRWDDPDVFDVRRDAVQHVGFGTGIHACLGQGFARLEAEALLTALAERIEELTPAGPPVRRRSNTVRAWASLPVQVTLAS